MRSAIGPPRENVGLFEQGVLTRFLDLSPLQLRSVNYGNKRGAQAIIAEELYGISRAARTVHY